MGQIKKQMQMIISDNKQSLLNWHDNEPSFFNWLIFEARAEIQKYFRWFLVQMKIFKSAFEINWPLTCVKNPQVFPLGDLFLGLDSAGSYLSFIMSSQLKVSIWILNWYFDFWNMECLIQEILAFHDFKIGDPRYFVI